MNQESILGNFPKLMPWSEVKNQEQQPKNQRNLLLWLTQLIQPIEWIPQWSLILLSNFLLVKIEFKIRLMISNWSLKKFKNGKKRWLQQEKMHKKNMSLNPSNLLNLKNLRSITSRLWWLSLSLFKKKLDSLTMISILSSTLHLIMTTLPICWFFKVNSPNGSTLISQLRVEKNLISSRTNKTSGWLLPHSQWKLLLGTEDYKKTMRSFWQTSGGWSSDTIILVTRWKKPSRTILSWWKTWDPNSSNKKISYPTLISSNSSQTRCRSS